MGKGVQLAVLSSNTFQFIKFDHNILRIKPAFN